MFAAENLLETLGTWGRRQPLHPAITIIATACDSTSASCTTCGTSCPAQPLTGETAPARSQDFAPLVESPCSWYLDKLFVAPPTIMVPVRGTAVPLDTRVRSQRHVMYCVPPRGRGGMWRAPVWSAVGERRTGNKAKTIRTAWAPSNPKLADHVLLLTVFTTQPEKLLGRLQPGKLRLARNGVRPFAVELPCIRLRGGS